MGWVLIRINMEYNAIKSEFLVCVKCNLFSPQFYCIWPKNIQEKISGVSQYYYVNILFFRITYEFLKKHAKIVKI